MNVREADSLPWLDQAQSRLRHAAAAGRFPHSLLLIGSPGLGTEILALWALGFVLCEGAQPRPCGTCASCLLLAADSHPDAHLVRIEEDAQQIKVDQVRELIETLSLTSYRGGYKVGLIVGAEALNANGANAFLKTLEEPTQNTLLILTAKPAHRLPATIASRCLRLGLRAPAPEVAREWLARTWRERQAEPCTDWGPALAVAGGAPLLALDLQADNLTRIDAQMRRCLELLASGGADLTLLAEEWVKDDPITRIVWLENWITERVTRELAGPPGVQTAEPVRLPGALLKPKIRNLLELLDAARQFRRFASTSMNQQLAVEALLIGGRAALAK